MTKTPPSKDKDFPIENAMLIRHVCTNMFSTSADMLISQ